MSLPSRRAARRTTTPLQRVVVLGALALFALAVAALVYKLATPSYRASALISTSPLIATGQQGDPSTDQADRFIQGELLFLNSSSLKGAVQRAAGIDQRPAISATQVGQTDALEVSAEATTAQDAEALADSAVALYVERRRGQLTRRLASVSSQLETLDKTLDDLDLDDPADRSRRVGLEEEYQRLISARNGLQVDLAGNDPVIESAAASGASRAVSPTIGIGLVGMLGLVLGLLVLVARRWTSGLVMDADDVAELGGRSTTPPLPCVADDWAQGLADRPSEDSLETAARLLAGALLVAGPAAPVVLVGPTTGVGASFAAVNVAAALARSRKTVLVCAGDALDDDVWTWLGLKPRARGLSDLADADVDGSALAVLLADTKVPGLKALSSGRPSPRQTELVERALGGPTVSRLRQAGYQVVVDAPALDRSRGVYQLAGEKPAVGLVVGAGITGDRELADALTALQSGGLEVATVCLDYVPAGARRS